MADTSIEWTDVTWNPVRGCARVSPGCENCYAENQAHRFSGPGKPYEGLTVLGKHGPRWAGRARFVPEMLDRPLRWRGSRLVFVNSMSDLFHEDVTNEQIAAVFGVMAASPKNTFQVLTKRPERMRQWFAWAQAGAFDRVLCHADDKLKGSTIAFAHLAWAGRGGRPSVWPLPNVWIGCSVEDQQRADERVPLLLQVPAAVRFLSVEPMLGPVDLSPWLFEACSTCSGTTLVGPSGEACVCAIYSRHPGHQRRNLLHWVIVGGESGPGARTCSLESIRSIVRQCGEAGVPVFVKQLGAHPTGSRLPATFGRKGENVDAWPIDLRVRQFPEVHQ